MGSGLVCAEHQASLDHLLMPIRSEHQGSLGRLLCMHVLMPLRSEHQPLWAVCSARVCSCQSDPPFNNQHLVFSGGCQAVLWACQSVFAFDMGSVVSCGRSHLQLIAYTFFGTPASKVFTLYAKSEAIQVVGITSLLLCG